MRDRLASPLSRLLFVPSAFTLVLCACTVEGRGGSLDTDSPRGGDGGEPGDAEGCPRGTEVDGVTSRGNVICSNCDPGVYCAGGDRPARPCDNGTWDDDGDPGTACEQLTACLPGTYVEKPGAGTKDQKCAECAPFTFSDEKNAASCSPYRDCSAGQEWSDLNKTEDTSCTGCPEGSWDDDSDPATPCVEHSVCLPGEYEVDSGDATHDRDCDACVGGTYAAEENAPECKVWSTCPWGTLERGTASRDAECRVPVGIAAGFMHTCAVFSDGTVECWGDNQEGQLGNETVESSFSPVSVADVSSATAVASLVSHTCVVLETGKMACWGKPREAVPEVVNGITTATQASVGYTFACAVQRGAAQCWGTNSFGQLGDGTTTASSEPVIVSGAIKVTSLTTGDGHGCAVNDGAVQCWGYNGYGQLGVGTKTNSPVPVTISSLTGATSVAAGLYHTCAVLDDGTMKCWGDNDEGQLGDGSKVDRTTPVSVPQLTGVVRASANWHHTCALLTDGAVQCWGRNDEGQLGDGSRTGSAVPAVVQGIGDVTDLAVGEFHTCVITAEHDIYCWGDNTLGQLGRLTTGLESETPILVLPEPG